MNWLLDTNTWVSYLRNKDQTLIARFHQVNSTDIALSSIVLGELYYGAYHAPAQFRQQYLNLVSRLHAKFDIIEFEALAADYYGRIRSDLAAKGMQIGSNDLLIAATALVHGLVEVTHNTSEFSRVPGLMIEDWQSS